MSTTLESVPLATAMLCVNCERVITCHGNHCPLCGSSAIFNLARMLQGKRRVGEAKTDPLSAFWDKV
jgi:hypothetical protein